MFNSGMIMERVVRLILLQLLINPLQLFQYLRPKVELVSLELTIYPYNMQIMC